MKRKALSICSLFLAALLLTGALCLTAACKKEKELTVTEYLDKVMEKTGDARVTGPVGKTKSVIEKSGVKYDLTFKPTDSLTQMLGGLASLPEITLSGVKNEGISRTSLSIAASGKTAGSTFTSDGKQLAVESDVFGKTYGVDLTKWKNNFKTSVFGTEGSKYYTGSGADAEEALETLSEYSDLLEMLKPYADIVKETLNTDCTTMEKLKEGGRKITVTLDNDGVKAIFKTLAEKAKEDEGLRAMVGKLLETSSLDSKKKFDEFFEAEDIGEKVDQFFEDKVKSTFSLTEIIVTDAEDLLKTFDLTLDVTDKDGKNKKAALTCDLTDKNRSAVSLALDGDWGENLPFKKAAINRVVTEDTEAAFKSYISVAVESAKMNVEARVLEFSYDCATRAYEAAVTVPGTDSQTYTLKGELLLEESAVEVTITSFESDSLKQLTALTGGDGAISLDLRLRVSQTDEKPTVPAYTDILSLSEGEVDELVEKIKSYVPADLPVSTLPL